MHTQLVCYIWASLELLVSCGTHCFMAAAVPSANLIHKDCLSFDLYSWKSGRNKLFIVWLRKSIGWKTNYVWYWVFTELITFIIFCSLLLVYQMKYPDNFSVISTCFSFPVESSWSFERPAENIEPQEFFLQSDLRSPSCTQREFANWPIKFMKDMNLLSMPCNNH